VTRVGPARDIEELERASDRFAAQVVSQLKWVTARAVKNLGGRVVVAQGGPDELPPFVSPQDIDGITTDWARVVDGQLLAELGDEYFASAGAQMGAVAQTVGRTMPIVDELLSADRYLANVRNRLVGIGDELWGHARDGLQEGMRLGESIPELASRVSEAANVTAPRAEVIARTEVISASNGGSIDAMRLSGLVTHKTWIAAMDARTRESHADADGQEVGLDEPFDVAGWSLDFPGDPIGPPEEVINCRCTMGYEVVSSEDEVEQTQSELGDDIVIAAAGDHEGGCMIALVPAVDDADRLTIDDGEPTEELHVTLAYLGKKADLTDKAIEHAYLVGERAAAEAEGIVEGVVAGFGTLGSEDPPATVLFMNSAEMDHIHTQVQLELRHDDLDKVYAEQHRPWIAHLTLGYGNDLAEADLRGEAVRFDRVRVAIGDDVTDFKLDDATVDSEQPKHEVKDDTMTTTVVDPATVTGGKPSEGTPADKRLKRNKNKADADPIAVLQGEECPPGHHPTPDGDECVPDEETSTSVPFSGVAVVEGQWTGDGRQFAPGALDWPDLSEVNVALQWQKETTHGGITDLVVNVGRVTDLTREGDKIAVRGYIDAASEDGAEVVRRMSLDPPTLGGVSIVADDPDQAEVEIVYREGCEDLEEKTPDEIDDVPIEELERCFMPIGVIFHSGRVRALTMVDTPAFVEASIRLDREDAVVASTTALGAVGTHETATSDGPWDAGAEQGKLDSPMSVDRARSMYAWVDDDAVEDGEITKSGCKFPHHEVGDGGSPGAANLTACSAVIGSLHGGRGSSPNIPSGDRRGVYDHVAKHIRDAGLEPPPFSVVDELEPLIAASHVIQIPDVPPREWFDEPERLPQIGALNVTDDGRVYGLLAPRNVPHRSFPNQRVTVPRGNVDYSKWMNRPTIVEGGERVATGVITMECGHAQAVPWVTAPMANDHYENSCSIVATVRIGENRMGVWVAGALLPDVTPAQVARMLACQLSGDWRPHREKPGMRELTAALLVPVPGFPRATGPTVQLDHGQLVASAVPVRWVHNSDVFVPEITAADTATADISDVGTDGEVTDPPADEPDDTTTHVHESDDTNAQKPETASVNMSGDELPGWEEVQRRLDTRRKLAALDASMFGGTDGV
jgi:2'-5' RNA ligase